MGLIRGTLLSNPVLALAIGLAALLLRLSVPAGFMPVATQGGPALVLCSGGGAPAAAAGQGAGHHDEGGADRANACAFADLALGATASAGAVLLGAALLFILAAALPPAALLPPRSALRLRPPLRGPPLPL